MTKPSKSAVLAWTRLVRAQETAMSSIQSALKKAKLPALEWYDVLLELENGGPMRPRDLQSRLLLAQYNLSRLLDRMKVAGLVTQTPCAEDARGHLVDISETGKALRRQMWPVYANALHQAVGVKLNDDEANALAGLLDRLRVH